jgi:SAM-dependent methyltransferase
MSESRFQEQELAQSRAYDLDIKNHYDKVAMVEKDSSSSTMADAYIRDNETKFIIDQIQKFKKVSDETKLGHETDPEKENFFTILDVGCGNGYTLDFVSDSFPSFSFQGIEMNDSLRQVAADRFVEKKVSIKHGDIRDTSTLQTGMVDILICQRVLINLLDPNDQKLALNNLINLVKSGGLLVFIACFASGLNNLNSARQEFGLDELPPAHHNLYLNDGFFRHKALVDFDNSQTELFSTHYFTSRVLHESFLKITQRDFIRNSHFVSFFSNALPKNIGEYSPLKALSFTKV